MPMKHTAAKKRNKIAILALTVIFVLATIMGLNIFTARGSTNPLPIENLRFRQIELGSDFAIAVTFEGDLYAWSLQPGALPTTFGSHEATGTLGEFYPARPTRINFAPTASGDSIRMVATTRYQAALVTQQGFVYTWGRHDTNRGINNIGAATASGMLLRTPATTVGQPPAFWPGRVGAHTTPAFEFFPGEDPETSLHPETSLQRLFTEGDGITSIFGAEDNFVIQSGNRWGAWGSNLFNQLNVAVADGQASIPFSGSQGRLSHFGNFNPAQMAVGDGFIAAVVDDQVQVSGRNFYIQYDDAGMQRPSPSFAFVAGSSVEGNENVSVNFSSDFISAAATQNEFGQVSGVVVDTNIRQPIFRNSNGTTLNDDANPSPLQHNRIAASHGVVYHIDGGVHVTGSPFGNQNASIRGALSALDTAVSVVVGRNAHNIGYFSSHDPSIRLYRVRADMAPIQDFVNFNDPNHAHLADFSNTTAFISGVLTSAGDVYAWNQNSTELSVLRHDALPGSLRIESISGGYGDILYALTNMGDIVRFTSASFNNDDNTLIPTFVTQFQQDDFRYAGGTGAPRGDADVIQINSWATFDAPRAVHFANSNAVAQTVTLGVVNNGVQNGFRSLDNTGSAFRIITDDNFLASGVTSLNETAVRDVNGNFFDFNAHDITFTNSEGRALDYQTMLARFFDFEIEVGSGNAEDAIRFVFRPRSTTHSAAWYNEEDHTRLLPNGIVTMHFWIGRFENASLFREDVLNRFFYDVQQASISIEVLPTDAAGGSMQAGAGAANNARQFAGHIPLLDINSDSPNHRYSVATMDVSAGFDSLARFIADAPNTGNAQSNAIEEAIILNNPDPGFRGVYQHFAVSRDGSLFWIHSTLQTGINQGAVLPELRMQSISTPLADLEGFDEDGIIGGLTWSQLNARIQREFNNIYGFNHWYTHDGVLANLTGGSGLTSDHFFGSSIRLSNTGVLTLSYQVVTFTAQEFTNYQRAGDNRFFSTVTWDQNDNHILTSQEGSRFTPTIFEHRVTRHGQTQAHTNTQLAHSFHADTAAFMVAHTHAPLRLSSGVTNHGYTAEFNQTLNIDIGESLNEGMIPTGVRFDVENNELRIQLNEIVAFPAQFGSGAGGFNEFVSQSGFDYSFASGGNDVNLGAFINRFNEAQVDRANSGLTADLLRLRFVGPVGTPENPLRFSVGILRTSRNGDYRQHIELSFSVVARLDVGILSANAQHISGVEIIGGVRALTLDTEQRTFTTAHFFPANFAPTLVNHVRITHVSIPGGGDILSSTIAEGNQSFTVTAGYSGIVFVNVRFELFGRHVQQVEFRITVQNITNHDSISIFNSRDITVAELAESIMRGNRHLPALQPANFQVALGDVSVRQQAYAGAEWVIVPQGDDQFVRLARINSMHPTNASQLHYLVLHVSLNPVATHTDAAATRIRVPFYHPQVAGFVGGYFYVDVPIRQAHRELTHLDEDGNSQNFVFNVHYHEGVRSTGHTSPQMPRLEDSRLILPTVFFLTLLGEGYDGQAFGAHSIVIDDYFGSYRQRDFVVSEIASHDGSHFAIDITGRFPTDILTSTAQEGAIRFRVRFQHSNPALQESRDFQLSFFVRVYGIRMTLTTQEYAFTFLWAALGVFAFLFILFIIRFAVFMRRRAKQKRIVKRNQQLIKMRDRMHDNANTHTRQNVVRAKVKMNDPKYAKMVGDARKERAAGGGDDTATTDRAAVIPTTKTIERVKSSKGEKKSKKSINDLKAELEAKRIALAQMQVQPGGATVLDSHSGFDEESQPLEINIHSMPVFEPSGEFGGYNPDLSSEAVDAQIKQKIAESNFGDDDQDAFADYGMTQDDVL